MKIFLKKIPLLYKVRHSFLDYKLIETLKVGYSAISSFHGNLPNFFFNCIKL